MEKQFGRFADIPARSKIALQTLTNVEINLNRCSKKFQTTSSSQKVV
jgi:hypothetical protein